MCAFLLEEYEGIILLTTHLQYCINDVCSGLNKILVFLLLLAN